MSTALMHCNFPRDYIGELFCLLFIENHFFCGNFIENTDSTFKCGY